MRKIPNEAQGLAQKGLGLFENARYAEALRAFSKASALEPQRCAWTLLSQAACLISLESPLKALTALEGHAHFHPGEGENAAAALRDEALRQAVAAGLMSPAVPHGLHWKPGLRTTLRLQALVERATNIYAEIEYATVREGVREIGFVNLRPNDPLVQRLERDGLSLRRLVRVKTYTGFAHHHIPAAADDPNSWEHTVIGRDPRRLDEVQELFKRGLDGAGHARIGVLLGFPPCCIEFFGRIWFDRQIWDPIFEAGLNTRGKRRGTVPGGRQVTLSGHPYCNTLLRYSGLRLASWLPCSLRCPETIARAQTWVDLGRRIDSRAVDSLLEILSLPLTWRCAGGEARVEAEKFYVSAASYCPQEVKVVRWSAA